jgi:predicted HTH domain antitoxin
MYVVSCTEIVMTMAIEISEEIVGVLQAKWGDVNKRALEAIALEGYRSGALSRAQVGQMLGLSYWETEMLLQERQAYMDYTLEDLNQDRETLDRVISK